MTKSEAIKRLQAVKSYMTSGNPMWSVEPIGEAMDMAIEALEQSQWIPVKWHEITDAEREENGYPKEWEVFLDCEMPSDDEKILVTTRYATVEADVCYEDGEFSLDSGYDWVDDIIAWMPLPEPYKGETDENME